jgi:hypothetical protein
MLAAQRSGDLSKFAELERIITQREAHDQIPALSGQKVAENNLGLDRETVGRLAFGDGYAELSPRALDTASGTFIAPTAELLAARVGGQLQGSATRSIDPNQVAAATLVLGTHLNPKALEAAGLQLGQPGAMSVQSARGFLEDLSDDPSLGKYVQTVLGVYDEMRNAPPGSQVGYQSFHSTVSQRFTDAANAAITYLADSGSIAS